jgi:chromosome segregation protein
MGAVHLKRLELQGFKTFAQKTVLEFLPDTGGRPGLTAIVGPNGSGKSNVADALRWVMGEQSLKLLRAKKSEDIVFSGSAKKSRAGFAEVSMTLVNDDRPEIDLPEIVATRRLYRNGQSEYEINKKSVRLTDVVLLLAQAGLGQRTYSVIGQGMVDSVLSATPLERKEFFDEAAGLKPLQLKKQASLNKLEATKDNLKQAELILHEISPRLGTLERQARRLEQRSAIEKELREAEVQYYGGVWFELRSKLAEVAVAIKQAEGKKAEYMKRVRGLEEELSALETSAPTSAGFKEIRQELDELARQRAGLREEQLKLESTREFSRLKSEKSWSPLPLSKIIETLERLRAQHESLWTAVGGAAPDFDQLKKLIAEIKKDNEHLLSQLQRPVAGQSSTAADPALEKKLHELAGEITRLDGLIKDAEARWENWNQSEQAGRARIFELQHKLTDGRKEASHVEGKLNETAVNLARLETRREGFLQDLRLHAPDSEQQLEGLADEFGAKKTPAEIEALAPQISKLRSKLEWIGSIDPEVIKEYEDTQKRFSDLETQTQDLKQAMASLESIIVELDVTIKERAETAFRVLDREFGNYFKKLFGGGEAKLVEIQSESEEVEIDEAAATEEEERVVGVEILATPPGKRLKSVALLSGGERALTSIALICAIMATNPSPFVVLDEVDAALDESNSRKFADIISQLADRTQFVVITHNRATMNQAHVLYGVTMGDDGVSQLLSVKLEEVNH